MGVLGTLFLLGCMMLTPGCWGLSCPKELTGYVGGSLSVSCRYKQGFEKYRKYWCKAHPILPSCSELVDSQSDRNRIKDRMSIRDNRVSQCVEVIMNNLTMADSGDYQCGIDYRFRPDPHCTIHVAVFPAPALDPEEWPTTSKPPEWLLTTKQHRISSSTQPPASHGFTETTDESRTFSTSTGSSSPEESHAYRLIYCIILLFILLLLAAIVLVGVSRKKRTGSCFPRKKEANLSVMVSTCKAEEPHYEDTAPDHTSDAEGTGIYRIVAIGPKKDYGETHFQEEPVENREEVSYTTLLHSDLQEQAIYDNIDIRQPATQEVIYAKVAKKPGGH